MNPKNLSLSVFVSHTHTHTHTYNGIWIVDHYHRCHLLQSSATIKGHPGVGNKRSPWALHMEPNDQSHKLKIKVSIGTGRGCREKRTTLDVLGCDGYQLDKFSWLKPPDWQLKIFVASQHNEWSLERQIITWCVLSLLMLTYFRRKYILLKYRSKSAKGYSKITILHFTLKPVCWTPFRVSGRFVVFDESWWKQTESGDALRDTATRCQDVKN